MFLCPLYNLSFAPYQNLTSHRRIWRMRFPYFSIIIGNGIIATATKANKELPQPIPSAENIGPPTTGNSAPPKERKIPVAARADAEYTP